SGTLHDLCATGLAAGPVAEDDVRRSPSHFGRIADRTVLVVAVPGQLGEAVLAPGDLDHVRHPADARGERIAHVLEEDSRLAPEMLGLVARLLDARLQVGEHAPTFVLPAAQNRERLHHGEDAGEVDLAIDV